MIVHVKIYYYSIFGKGKVSLEFQGDEVKVIDVLSKLEDEYGKIFESVSGRNLMKSFGTYFNLFLNGVHISLPRQMGMQLRDSDNLVILRPISGG